ncbi:FcoT-like thioesterase domain protein [Corynebacterium heidelbergense]|uniref:FcoT family thioesterase n=1 Tax=Corynebacterium heidelbergense TaxID=2055947 RepID=UPI00235A03DE|nr:FcoT family thioesterase [Corynebacterium heidelbergense]WCZ35656.1 FcoT-like thioesterase domain protein [Corynebacterium heidelbergense]
MNAVTARRGKPNRHSLRAPVSITAGGRTGIADAEEAIPEKLVAGTLKPYTAKGCRYLQHACYLAGGPELAAVGRFGIPTSAYIQDTGHFNAAEFIIAYNQLFYCLLAEAVRRGDIAPLLGWTAADLRTRQLPDVLIQRNDSEFLAPIDARQFTGVIRVTGMRLVHRRHRYVQMDTAVEFWGGDGSPGPQAPQGGAAPAEGEAPESDARGRARGNVTIAVLLREDDSESAPPTTHRPKGAR